VLRIPAGPEPTHRMHSAPRPASSLRSPATMSYILRRLVLVAVAATSVARAEPGQPVVASATAPATAMRLAVLTPRASWSERCAALPFTGSRDAALARRCRVLEAAADSLRGGAAGAVQPGIVVWNRAETLRRVLAMRRPPRCPTPAACDLDIGHLLGADLLLTSAVTTSGAAWSARLELRSVSDGTLLGSADAAAGDADGFGQALAEAAARLTAHPGRW
jgi:hypothetical protein